MRGSIRDSEAAVPKIRVARVIAFVRLCNRTAQRKRAAYWSKFKAQEADYVGIAKIARLALPHLRRHCQAFT